MGTRYDLRIWLDPSLRCVPALITGCKAERVSGNATVFKEKTCRTEDMSCPGVDGEKGAEGPPETSCVTPALLEASLFFPNLTRPLATPAMARPCPAHGKAPGAFSFVLAAGWVRPVHSAHQAATVPWLMGPAQPVFDLGLSWE